jgi:hypothetical protein
MELGLPKIKGEKMGQITTTVLGIPWTLLQVLDRANFQGRVVLLLIV